MSLESVGANRNHSVKMDRQTIKEMVVAYRENRPIQKNFNYAHFGAEEVIQLFIDNGIISNVEFNNTEKFGLKIYIGNHFELSNCPGSNEAERARYLNFNTTILCNTIIRGAYQFEDILTNEANMTTLSADSSDPNDGGYGLDQSVLCPPDCMEECIPDANEQDYCIFDVGREPT
ncbi:hypothetical protein [Pedobacter insulae]|uniref:Uncharacterized protein n=1 Tax=Pedobacter insulae TaxID=414048 RepID=A0A1I2YVU4_9SPHI|nr:hypothetical protein [Pedobacter insulae]SFH29752.1 hypothetical protein SAMN04489864_108120 [Pedobacter insulae]